MKRIILFCFLLGLISPIAIEAKKKPFGDGLFWELSKDGTLTISGRGGIPNWEKCPWRKVTKKVRKVVIEKGVTSIGKDAFYSCYNLEAVHITDLEAWCKISFDSYSSNPLDYAHHLFLNGKEIKDLWIPNSVTSIRNYAFCDCSGLTSITIPSSVKSIGSYAFSGCSGLTSVTIPNSVAIISKRAFENCRHLTSVTIPSSVSSIGEYTFSDCSGLTSVTIPSSVIIIGNNAFRNCSGLTSVAIPNSVTSIGESAFKGCKSLPCISIPKSVTSIGKEAFCTIPVEGKYDSYYYFNGEILNMPDYMLNCEHGYGGINSKAIERYKIGYKNGIVDNDGNLILAGKEGRKYNKVIDKVFVGVDYYIVEENGRVGLVDNTKKWIVPLTDSYRKIEGAGGGYFSVQDKNYTYSIIDTWGNTIIPASMGYSYIGNYNSTTKTFNVSKGRYDGTCDKNGRELSMTKRPPTKYDIKYDGGYSDVTEITNDGIKYFLVTKNGHKGLTDSQGKVIIEADLELLEQAGTGFLRFKVGDFYGIMNYQGKTLIPTSRGYTKIGNYVASQKVFSYEANGYKGECNHLGVQISKINTSSATDSSSSGGKTSNTTTTTSDKNKTDTKEQKIIIEHHRDPVPVQQWQACWACGGMGTMGCDNCGGSGTKYIGDRLHICSRCNGQRLIPCNICHGNKGQYTTVYQ